MTLLLVAATPGEVDGVAQALAGRVPAPGSLSRLTHPRHDIHLLVTGVGPVATAVSCARTLERLKPDVALNVGVCGSFLPSLPPPIAVHIVSERLVELGAQDGDTFLSVQEMGLLGDDDPPFREGRLVNAAPPVSTTLASLPAVHGITVSTVHGHEPSIARTVARWAPDVESMEGGAFLYACLTAGVPCAQIRTVSNRVERRNREAWRLGEAVAELTRVALAVVDDL